MSVEWLHFVFTVLNMNVHVQEKLAVGEGAQKPLAPEGDNKPLNPSEKSWEQFHHSVNLG